MPRTEEWGDDKSERDADAALAQAEVDGREGVGEEARTLWYFIRRSGKRIAVAIGGFVLILGGLILIPLPGPGWLIVFAGLALLATEFVWAERLLRFAKERVSQVTDAVIGEKGKRSGWAIGSLVIALMAPALAFIDRFTLFWDLSAARLWIDRFGTVLAVIAVTCGHIALSRIKAEDGVRGKLLAVAGLVIGYGYILAFLATWIP